MNQLQTVVAGILMTEHARRNFITKAHGGCRWPFMARLLHAGDADLVVLEPTERDVLNRELAGRGLRIAWKSSESWRVVRG